MVYRPFKGAVFVLINKSKLSAAEWFERKSFSKSMIFHQEDRPFNFLGLNYLLIL